MRFHPRVKLPLSMRKRLQVVARSVESEISFQGDFSNFITSVLKTEAKFQPGANSLCFQCVTQTNFQPGLIL